MTRGAGRAARRAAWASLLWGLAGLVCAGPAAPAPPGGPAGPGPAAPGPWSVEPLPLVEALRQRPLPAQATPLSAQAAERRLAAALRAAPLPPGAAVQLGCADRQLWVRLQAQDPAAVAAALPALDAALARAVRERPPRKGELSLAELDALLSDLDRLDQARGAVGAGPSGGWVGGGAFAVQVDGLPLLRIRLLVGGLGPIDAPGGAAERAAALDGGGPAGLGAALRAAGVGAWERGAAARPDGLLRLWVDVLPAQAPAALRALEEAAARVIAAPPGAPLPAWAAAPARVGPPAEARPSEGQRLLLIGDLDAAPVDLRARRDWPSARPSPAALGRQLGRVEGLGCGGRGPAPLRREPGPAAG